MGRYRKKPVEIEAFQFDGHNYDRLAVWMGDAPTRMQSPADTLDMYIDTLEGTMHVSPGDWVIRGVKGEFYPCKPDIFDATYFESPEVPAGHALVVTLDVEEGDVEAQVCTPDDYVIVTGPEVEITNVQVYPGSGTRQLTLKKRGG